jgi:RecQ family ATP-dependent DNA helicase
MTKDMKELAQAGCPWLQRYTVAAYACEAVAGLFSAPWPFRSPEMRCLWHARGSCAIAPGMRAENQRATSEAKFFGAVLGKQVHRGLPAPCSLAVERQVLQAAREAEVLDFQESVPTGEFHFCCRPRLPGLARLLHVCLVPELLVDDADVSGLLEHYRSLATSAERELFDELLRLLPEPRLGLLWLAERPIPSMVQLAAGSTRFAASRVDFALEIPRLPGPGWLRMVLELDDVTHTEVQRKQDQERDRCLQGAGWRVCRLHINRRSDWKPRLEESIQALRAALPEEYLIAAQELRALPAGQRQAIQNLVLLPVAEAQIAAALSQFVYRGYCGELRIGDPQGHGLGPVVQAVNAMIETLKRLHNLQLDLRLVQDPSEADRADLLYFGAPTPAAWHALQQGGPAVIVPRPVWEGYLEPLLPARPRPVEVFASGRAAAIRTSLAHYLQNIFRKREFREGQLAIIERALTLKPVVGLLPTGAGKSLCFQLASLVQPGFTLVVDPLRSLMLDQRENLEALGIHRCCAIMRGSASTAIENQRAREESYQAVENGQYLFVFIAPERLQMPGFRQHVRGFAGSIPVPYCVVDEAHCVSEWGHDFRLAYLNIGRVVREYCRYEGHQPCVMALTGTASRNVLVDILRELAIDDLEAIIEPRSLDRAELAFEVYQVKASERLSEIVGKLRPLLLQEGWQPGQPDNPPSGLIFTNFAKARSIGVEDIAQELSNRLGLAVEIYCGQRPSGVAYSEHDWELRKLEIQHRFKMDQSPVMVCTHSFGMGIDKPDIRFTIHAMLPRSLEDFYQQAGRAGRDGTPARCLIFFSDDQPGLANELLDTERTPLEAIARRARAVARMGQGDAIRNTWFLTNNFQGRAAEKSFLTYVVTRILAPRLTSHRGDGSPLEIRFSALPDPLFETDGNNRPGSETKTQALEKALYRLVLVGALDDYMKDYGKSRFVVDLCARDPHQIYTELESYLRRYATQYEVQRFLPKGRCADWCGAASDCGAAVVDYIYQTIEKRRRRAIGQMLLVARDAAREESASSGNQRFREQLLAYLEESEFTKPVASLATNIAPDEWFQILDQVQGVDGTTKLLGACRRQLEESPSHPGLLLLAGLCRMTTPHSEQAVQDIRSSFTVLRQYNHDPVCRVRIAEQVVEHVQRLVPSQLDSVLFAMLESDPSRDMARYCYEKAPSYGEAHALAIRCLAQELITVLPGKRKVL